MTAADCVAPWRELLTDNEYRLAIAMIEQYASERALGATNECIAAMQKAFTDPFSRDEKLN